MSATDYADKPPRAMADGEVLALGRHEVRWLDIPTYPTPGSADF